VTEDERIDEEHATPEDAEDVEGHGVKEVAGVGLAAAALIGAGAVGVKVATDDDKSRNQAALVAEDTRERLAKADADGDGFVDYRDLSDVGMKIAPDELRAEGYDVTSEALASAGVKIELAVIGKEEGFAVEGETIMLKTEVDQRLDEIAKSSALEWADKHKEIDRDGDGYAGGVELLEAGYKVMTTDLEEAGYKEVDLKALEEAGMKINLATLGEGGYSVEDGTIFHKDGLDEKLDAFVKGE
jgi:hypothetical protein